MLQRRLRGDVDLAEATERAAQHLVLQVYLVELAGVRMLVVTLLAAKLPLGVAARDGERGLEQESLYEHAEDHPTGPPSRLERHQLCWRLTALFFALRGMTHDDHRIDDREGLTPPA